MGQVIPLSAEAEARPKPVGKISYEEFLEWYGDTHAEWVDGEVLKRHSPSLAHQDDLGFLLTLLRIYIEARDLGRIVSGCFQMYLADQKTGREPDLAFIAKENIAQLKPMYVDGAADMVVEIISLESVGRDRGDKFVEYEAAGVREYWLIDPQRKQAEFYVLDDERRYQLILSGKEGRFESKALEGFYLQIEWLWQKPLPKVVPILKEMGIL